MSISFFIVGRRGSINLKHQRNVQSNGFVMLHQGILPCSRIGGMELYQLVPTDNDIFSMNKKSRMMGDCHVRFCERLTNVGLLDYKGR